jgi:hypothetical protein
MNALVSPICDSAVARQNLLGEIDRLADIVQDLEGRLQQVTVQSGSIGSTCAPGAPTPMRSVFADEIYNRAERISGISDRLINLRNSLDL